MNNKSNSVNGNKNIILTDKTGFYDKKAHLFDESNTTIIIIVFLIAICFIAYVVYVYYYRNTDYEIKNNSSYYGSDIALYDPLFKEKVNTINDCITMCESDITCDGITFNNNTNTCMGTKNGTIRNETADYSAWVKPIGQKPTSTIDITKSVLVGYTKEFRVVNGDKIPRPFMLGNFTWSFNIVIYDFYKNYGSWRHIFHKGTDITPGTVLSYQSWENLIKEIPKQSIGVWIAPFTNNLRIAVTTTSLTNRNYGSYQDAFVQKCDVAGNCYITDLPGGKWADTSRMGDGSTPKSTMETNIEYFDSDLQNIPINTQLNITINFINTIAEVYFNGKIKKVFQLNGTPINDKTSLYVLNDKTVNCEISNLLYFPDNVKLADISKIMSLSPSSPSSSPSSPSSSS